MRTGFQGDIAPYLDAWTALPAAARARLRRWYVTAGDGAAPQCGPAEAALGCGAERRTNKEGWPPNLGEAASLSPAVITAEVVPGLLLESLADNCRLMAHTLLGDDAAAFLGILDGGARPAVTLLADLAGANADFAALHGSAPALPPSTFVLPALNRMLVRGAMEDADSHTQNVVDLLASRLVAGGDAIADALPLITNAAGMSALLKAEIAARLRHAAALGQLRLHANRATILDELIAAVTAPPPLSSMIWSRSNAARSYSSFLEASFISVSSSLISVTISNGCSCTRADSSSSPSRITRRLS